MTGSIRTLDPLTLPLRGSQLIEASAGTGKTFTLALLYVRLVLGQRTAEEPLGEGIMPPNLLVVTFTEAATKELRDRIRARLTEAAALFAVKQETVDTSARANRQRTTNRARASRSVTAPVASGRARVRWTWPSRWRSA